MGDHEPRPRHEERRQRLHGEPDREVSGAPDEVDGGEGSEQTGSHRPNIAALTGALPPLLKRFGYYIIAV